MKIVAQQHISQVLRTRTIRRIHTKNRGSGQEPYVELEFRDSIKRYELHAMPGYKIVSAMINTVRYQPEITHTTFKVVAGTVVLELNAKGAYKVCEFIAARIWSEADPSAIGFELRMFEPTEGRDA